MKVFYHHIYEYRKGLRNLILHTVSAEHQGQIEDRLSRGGIAYKIYPLTNGNINVFFGARECVDIVKAIAKSSLTDYTPQEDFILGTMLGYDRLVQCRRFLGLISDGVDKSFDEPEILSRVCSVNIKGSDCYCAYSGVMEVGDISNIKKY